MDWCLNNSKGLLNEYAIIAYGQQLQNQTMIDPAQVTSLYTYNCQKLWEDEIKFSIAILIIMSICYVSGRNYTKWYLRC